MWIQNRAVSHPTALVLHSIRKNVMLPEVQKLKSLPGLQGGVPSQALGQGNGLDVGPDRTPASKKNKPPKTMSKQITSCISSCSAKMTEILSWQAKLAENKNGLILAQKNMFHSLLQSQGIHVLILPANKFLDTYHSLRISTGS